MVTKYHFCVEFRELFHLTLRYIKLRTKYMLLQAEHENRHSSKSIWVIKVSFCQNDPPIGELFWQKASLITHTLFELCLRILIFSPVKIIMRQPLYLSRYIKLSFLSSKTTSSPNHLLTIMVERRSFTKAKSTPWTKAAMASLNRCLYLS